MKFKTTLILLAVFIVLLGAVLLFEPKKKDKNLKEEKLVELTSADIEKITLKKEDGIISLQKDNKGEWMIIVPLLAKADASEAGRFADDFAGLGIERIVETDAKDPAQYEIPKKEVSIWTKGKDQPVKILIGMENPLDKTFFAMKEDDKRIVLISSSFKSLLEKKTFDFRQKDVFKFETADVKTIRLKAKDIVWEAVDMAGEWFLENPLSALAKKSKIDDVLNTLANMKAKEFVSESKKPEEVKKFGLAKPEYEVALKLPAKSQEMTFALHKEGDKIYAATTLSDKIIAVESQILTDLEKKAEDLREKQVVVFNSWQAKKLTIKKGGQTLTLAKDKDDKWRFESGAKEEADGAKIESFIRKIEGLEAAEFIDKPAGLKDYGLDPAAAEVAISTAVDEKTDKEVRVFAGTEDTAKKQVVVRNSKLSYLFRVDASFLADFPKEEKDWRAAQPDKK